jgi:hypothetical protein
VPALPPVQGRETDYFNLLAHGFLKGQLSLDYAVPDALLHAENPYDPAKRPPGSNLHDASLYRGKYYIYFGAAPVVTLLVPFLLATGRDLPLSYGIFFFAALGYLALIGLFLHLRRKHFPSAGIAETLACLLALSFATPVSFLLRRHSLYEFPIAGGFCFFMICLGCLFRSFDAAHPRRWLAGAGIFLGLAVGSRPTYAFCACIFLVPFLIRPKDAALRLGWKEFFSATVPLGVLVSIILAYNYARFDNPLEFGVTYELSGIVEAKARHFSLSYIPVNVWVYFLAPLRWGRYFPFIHGIAPPSLPKDYGEIEAAFGSVTNLPFLVLGLVPLIAGVALRLRSGRWTAAHRAVAIVGAATGAVGAFLCCFYWAVGRYMTDFTPALTLLSAMGFLTLVGACRSRLRRSLALSIGWAAMVVSALTATFLNFESYGKFQQWSPRQYTAVSNALDSPLFLMEGRDRSDIGPLKITLHPPFGSPGTRQCIVETGWPNQTDRLFIEVPDAGHLRFGYSHGSSALRFLSPPVAIAPDKSQSFEVDMGSLYPPANHPFYRGMSEAEVLHLRNWVRIRWNGAWIWEDPAQFYEAAPESIRVGRRASGLDGSPGFAGAVALRGRGTIDKGSDHPWKAGGARIAFTMRPDFAGRSFPLVTTGQTDIGDALFLRFLPDGKAQFGYDHWAGALRQSPVISLSPGREHVIEFWIPSMVKDSSHKPLAVRLDGEVVWKENVDYYACGPYQVFLARNVTGASTSEASFEGAKAEPLDEATDPEPR